MNRSNISCGSNHNFSAVDRRARSFSEGLSSSLEDDTIFSDDSGNSTVLFESFTRCLVSAELSLGVVWILDLKVDVGISLVLDTDSNSVVDVVLVTTVDSGLVKELDSSSDADEAAMGGLAGWFGAISGSGSGSAWYEARSGNWIDERTGSSNNP